MPQRDDLDKWVSAENVAGCRERLADPSYSGLHPQYQNMLDRELAKIKAAFPT